MLVSPHLCRLEQLMVMGSFVLKEESGFRAFYHGLLQPYEHYLPVWKEVRGREQGISAKGGARREMQGGVLRAVGAVDLCRTQSRTCICPPPTSAAGRLGSPEPGFTAPTLQGPEDVFEAVAWARANESAARAMAERAQRLAVQYLSGEAVSCYWYTLLARMAPLMRYRPDSGTHRRYGFVAPVSEYLGSAEVKALVRKYKLGDMELPRRWEDVQGQ